MVLFPSFPKYGSSETDASSGTGVTTDSPFIVSQFPSEGAQPKLRSKLTRLGLAYYLEAPAATVRCTCPDNSLLGRKKQILYQVHSRIACQTSSSAKASKQIFVLIKTDKNLQTDDTSWMDDYET